LHFIANPDTGFGLADAAGTSHPDGFFKVRTATARSSHVPFRAVLRGFSDVLHGQAEMSAAFPPSVS
jgi:hypothetical protein